MASDKVESICAPNGDHSLLALLQSHQRSGGLPFLKKGNRRTDLEKRSAADTGKEGNYQNFPSGGRTGVLLPDILGSE